MEVSEGRHRIDYLDAVRGLAAMAVVVYHYVLAYGLPSHSRLLTRTPISMAWNRHSAVSMFFVLSGLVLSIRYFRHAERADTGGIRYPSFVVSRLCRIGIPYLAVLFLSAAAWDLSAKHLVTTPPASEWLTVQCWSRPPTLELLAKESALFVIGEPRADGRYSLVPQAWSLSVELVVSLLVPAGVAVAIRSTGWLLVAGGLVATLAGGNVFVFHFALGIALAKHFHSLAAFAGDNRMRLVITALAGIGLYSYNVFLQRIDWLHTEHLDAIATGIGSAILLVFLAATPTLQRVMTTSPLHHLGRISFSLYLVHLLVILCITPRILHLLPSLPHPAAWFIGLLATALVSIVASLLLYPSIESPAMAIGRWVSMKLNRP